LEGVMSSDIVTGLLILVAVVVVFITHPEARQ
jgi:hypothetical protein